MQRPLTLITGGSRGIGRALALELAGRGHDLILTWQSQQLAAEEVLEELRARGSTARAMQFDAADPEAPAALAAGLAVLLEDAFGRTTLDALVNNAGHGHSAPFETTTVSAFEELMRVHLQAPFFLTQALLPMLAEGGTVLNVSSGLARVCRPGYSAYGAMKAAVEALTRYQSQELAARGIRVNVVAPGALATDFLGGTVRDTPAVQAYLASQTALGRVGTAEDAARAMAAMLSSDFGWVTGQRVEVSGGFAL